MKLKRLTAKLLAAAMIVTSLPVGLGGAGWQVSAETVDEVGDGLNLTNYAKDKYVTVSGSSGEQDYLVTNAVDGNLETKWKSAAVSANASQWLQIDLEEPETAVEEIKVQFADKAWSTDYTISTSDHLAEDAWTTVAHVQNEDKEEEAHCDKVTRNNMTADSQKKIVLHRYVRFTFTAASAHAADKKLVISEIEINSPGFRDVRGPKVAVPAPVSGEYPQIAEVSAPVEHAVHHEDVADRTDPQATLIKAATGTVTERNVSFNGTTIADKVRENGKSVTSGTEFPAAAYGQNSVNTNAEGYAAALEKYLADENGFAYMQKDGVFGFSGLMQTPGTLNKFDVFGTDVKIISFQLFMARKPQQIGNDPNDKERWRIFSKGAKYQLEADYEKLCLSMTRANTDGGGSKWPEEAFWFDTTKNPLYEGDAEFFGKWHDVLIVVDGSGRQRLYVDGLAARTKQGGNALAAEAEDMARAPFSFGYTAVAANNDKEQPFTLEMDNPDSAPAGYIARFKFYTNKNYDGMINGSYNDVSDAKILSDEFDNTNAATDQSKFSILNLERKVGAADNNNASGETEENLRKKSKVYQIITNMLQDESPTMRITLCPYSRSTIWYAYDATAKKWNQMPATGEGSVFKDDVKYRAQTRLITDTGYKFGPDSRTQVISELEGNGGASSVKLTNNSKELLITTYFNCTESELEDPEIAQDDVDCDIIKFAVSADELDLTKGESYSLEKPYSAASACAVHTGKVSVKTEYTLVENGEEVSGNDGTYLKLETGEDETLTITPKASTMQMIGDVPVAVKVTGKLVDEDGAQVSNTDGPVIREVMISVKVNPETVTLSTAPAITLEAPEAGVFPKTAEVRAPEAKEEEHHTNVADRMQPMATFQPMSDIPEGVTASVENKDGVWGFSAWGETPGYQNKFDVLGSDIKVIAFKFYLKEFPAAGQDMQQSIFGKGNQYAMQIDNTKLNLFMLNTSGKWSEQKYDIPDKASFTNKWHDIFVIVDGKGKMRFYVDGNKSQDKLNPDDAFSDDAVGQRKPFSFGYNLGDGNPQRQMFKNGYIADMEFYTNKDYYGVINGAGTDISDANILSAELAKNLSIVELEREYADRPEDLNRLITNLLQSENATVDLSVSPYSIKTVWSQKVNGEWAEPDPNAQFSALSEAKATVTLTAHKGFKFPTDQSAKSAMENAVKEMLGAEDADTEAKLVADSKTVTISEDGKTMTVQAAFTATEEASCTCEITELNLPESRISIEIPEGQTSAVASDKLTDLNAAESLTGIVRKNNCLVSGHNYGSYKFDYTVSEADQEVVRIVTPATPQAASDKIALEARKKGTASIAVTVTYTVEGMEPKTKSAAVTVNVTQAGEASSSDKTQLGSAADTALEDYPLDAEEDYLEEEWAELQAAIAEAKRLSTDPNATASAVAAAKERLEAAIAAMANAKSPKRLAKDALKEVLENAELKALIEGNNSDKKYTAESFGKLKAAYADAESKLNTADAATLGTLKTALEAAWKGLDEVKTIQTGGGSTIKDGTKLTGADGTGYQVVSGKDMTVIVTKGVDAKSIKVGPTVTIGKDTFKVIGIGNGAFKGLKKASKLTIDANVASIGDQAFANAKKLKTVTLGKDVAKIGKKAFFKCPKLNKVILKGKALTDKGVGGSAFKKTAKKASVKWGPVKGKARTKLKKKLKKAGLKVK